ncbi:hypothetical protein [Candidatus Scalindua japonica]|uniref:hypothetical protein n=1 Tax=Candidatus Scalindua japonica TaxID=1284222 RepID=UPI000BDE8CF3|nr:hypothetical protein [Candidatus Scalindua japonica]
MQNLNLTLLKNYEIHFLDWILYIRRQAAFVYETGVMVQVVVIVEEKSINTCSGTPDMVKQTNRN